MKKKFWALLLVLIMILLATTACGGKTESNKDDSAAEPSTSGEVAETGPEQTFTSAILIPGTLGDNPIFQMMVEGAQEAAAELGVSEPKVVEGGDDYAGYEKLFLSLAESKSYDLLITYTDSMVESVLKIAAMYPEQKIQLLDGDIIGIGQEVPSNVYSCRFKNEDLGYLGGCFAGLLTKSDLPYANEDLKVGLIFTDIYPAWTNYIQPAFENGAKSIDPHIEVVFSVVGNWVDPLKGAEVARAQFSQGVDVVWFTTGASTYGAVDEAKRQQKYAICSDNNGISAAPDVILGCTLITGKDTAKESFIKAYKDELPYGTAEDLGAKEGVVSFTFDDPNYLENVPEEIRNKMEAIYKDLADGRIDPLAK
jgi:basic membrane lipoprotein Med (substrate-binding protein (PBP1-ABC) superfamily)